MRTCYILARIDTSGPAPMVVAVNSYSEPNPTSDLNCRWWLLTEASAETLEKARLKAAERLHGWHAWAIPWLTGYYKLPHSGR